MENNSYDHLYLITGFLALGRLKIMKSKLMYARHRWIWSIIIFTLPGLGMFIYQIFRNTIPMKEYRFFSERFIDKYLS